MKRSMRHSLHLLAGLLLAGSVQGQDADADGKPSLLEQVYQNRLALMEDSLFITREKFQAADFLVDQVERQLELARDSLILAQAETGQWADSVASLLIISDRQRSENSQHLARLSALSDSLARSYIREGGLQSLNDSLLAILNEAQAYLVLAGQNEETVNDSLEWLRSSLKRVQSRMSQSELLLTNQLERLQSAVMSQGGISIDTALDNQNLEYLRELLQYQTGRRGLGRFFGGPGVDLSDFKRAELALYLAQVRQKGQAASALAMLAGHYVANDEPVKGALAYLKVIFLYPESAAWTEARAKVVGLIERDSEEGRLLFDVALNADSMRVGSDPFFRTIHYLDHLRGLTSETAQRWFIRECHNFMVLYPGVAQTDKVLNWLAQTYSVLTEHHQALLINQKLIALYPRSIFLPDAMLALAEITANALDKPEEGIERYAKFIEDYPNHPEAPRALLDQAILLEERQKDYQRAGSLYRRLADDYPGSPVAPIGLFRYGALLQGRLRSSSSAIEVYEEILSSHGDDPDSGIPALQHLADLSLKLDQYDVAVVYYLDIPGRYPEAEEQGVEAILNAADVYQSDLDNLDAAIHTLHMIIDNYPDYPRLKSVQKRVLKLQKKRG